MGAAHLNLSETCHVKPNLNTDFREELDLEGESAKFRSAWHYVWVVPGVLAQRPAVPAEIGRAA
jgi:hypothetical protein